MKSLIVYYSYSGNTGKAANILKECMSKRGEADIAALKPEDESGNFFRQAVRAARRKRAVLSQAPFDAAGYDMICIGSPVWAFAPAPAVNTYIDGLRNIRGKDAACFITYGSGFGADSCLDKMKAALRAKGVFKLFSFKIQQDKVSDERFIIEAIEKAIR